MSSYLRFENELNFKQPKEELFRIHYDNISKAGLTIEENGDNKRINCEIHLLLDAEEGRHISHISIKLLNVKDSCAEENGSEYTVQNVQWKHLNPNFVIVEADLKDALRMPSNGRSYHLKKCSEYRLVVEVSHSTFGVIAKKTKPFKVEIKRLKRKRKDSHNDLLDVLPPSQRPRLPLKEESPKLFGDCNTRSPSDYRDYFGSSPSSGNESLSTSFGLSPKREFSPALSLSPLASPDLDCSTLITNELKTKELEVDGTFMGKFLQTSNADIAYHFRLNEDQLNFEEGEIVGFVGSGDEQRVVKLTLWNCVDVRFKGVVTRQQYLEAHRPKDPSIKTETICMYGCVPVRVHGSIAANDPLYASLIRPGYAVSGNSLNRSQQIESAFIGTAISSWSIDEETESDGIVKAMVSLNDNLNQQNANQRVTKMGKKFSRKLQKVENKSKKWRKRCVCVSSIVLVLMILVVILLWQIYVPGTAYRYWKCRKGHKVPKASAKFDFIPYRDMSRRVKSSGLEFAFEEMVKKMNFKEGTMKPVNEELVRKNYPGVLPKGVGIRYYVNIERCAYGGSYTTSSASGQQETIGGPNVFAVDTQCNHVYYHNGLPPAHWKPYNSASWDTWHNVFCDPPPVNRTWAEPTPAVKIHQ
ncbi:uncharacterized protein [Clytia hemisphaerica]|eukprot:TCONS_00067866-protein